MTSKFTLQLQHPHILKVSQPELNGVQALNLSRHLIGYVAKGTKYIYNGNACQEVRSGDIYFLCSGTHYMEDIPVDNQYEEILFYYSSEELNLILSSLSANFGYTVFNDHTCENCQQNNVVRYETSRVVRNFFSSVNLCISEGVIASDHTLQKIKMTELIYLTVSDKDCCLKSKIIEYSDSAKDNFQQIIYDNIFKDVSLETIARLCNRSLTSFKKEFKQHFFESPHKWFIRQRLIHARLLLIASSKPIVEISNECSFRNVSHFIKLFRGVYGMTPAVYRAKHKNTRQSELQKA